MNSRILCLLGVQCVLMMLVVPGLGGEVKWVEDSFEDFADGTFDASGQNIYVSRDGKIRTIHKFDINQDGYLDLLFGNTHDFKNTVYSTLVKVTHDSKVEIKDSVALGALRVLVEDFNVDGFLDMAFSPSDDSTKGKLDELNIAWGGEDGWVSRRYNGQLLVHDPERIALADLNCDGYPEIAVINRKGWLPGHHKGKILRIFQGSKNGYSALKLKDINVSDAVDLASGDLDENGFLDLAVLTTKGKIKVFWAGTDLDNLANDEIALPVNTQELDKPADEKIVYYFRLPGKGFSCLTAEDIDGDSLTDLVVGTRRSKMYIVGGLKGRRWSEAIDMPAFDATRITAGDLDKDGFNDLVLTQVAYTRPSLGETIGSVRGAKNYPSILWGSKNGFSKANSLVLEVEQASSSAIGDINGDGHLDIALSVYQGDKAFSAKSKILIGNGTRHFKSTIDVSTTGATDVAMISATRNSPGYAIYCNSIAGVLHENVTQSLYLGGAKGFSPDRHFEIPVRSGYVSLGADFDFDGYTDVAVVNSGHVSVELSDIDTTLGVNLFYGGKSGFDFSKPRTILREYQISTMNTADFNRDGYLDIVSSRFPKKQGEPDEEVAIYYGSEQGFTQENRLAIPLGAYCYGVVVADFDKDDWLDIVVTSFDQGEVIIFKGSPDGFDLNRREELHSSGPIGVETADLNNDSYLDLIVATFKDKKTGYCGVGIRIFWGRTDGFKDWDSQTLPGYQPVCPAVADFDGDGYLDIFSPHYKMVLTRESIPSFLYWGSKKGYSVLNKTNLVGDAISDGMAGDFNGDGLLDLAVACHSKAGDHNTNSKVFYNDGNRFDDPEVTKLPTHGAHLIWSHDVGHIYDRSYKQSYESSVLKWNSSLKIGNISCKANIPGECKLSLEVRSAANEKSITKKPWKQVSNNSFKVNSKDHCMQYRVILVSDNGDRYPVIDSVKVVLK